jgi:hypothetical protein
MPSDQRLRLHDDERGFPIHQPSEHDERDARRVSGSAALDPTLRVQGELLPQQEALGCQSRPRTEPERQEHQRVNQQAAGSSPRAGPGRSFLHAAACHALKTASPIQDQEQARQFSGNVDYCGPQGPPARKTVRAGNDYAVGHANVVLTYSKDNLAHLIYPGGVTQQDWAHDLPRLINETW